MREIPVEKCPLCGSTNRAAYAYAKSTVKTEASEDATPLYHICFECGLLYQDPRWDFDYEEEYRSKVIGQDEKVSTSSYVTETTRGLHIVNYIQTYLPRPQSLLDIGCSVGHLLKVSEVRFGCKIIGVDPGVWARTTANEKYGVHVVPSIQDLPADENYDTIVCSHTLEHIIDLHEFVESFPTIKQPGPIYVHQHLVIEVPNAYSAGFASVAHPIAWGTGPLKRLFNEHGWGGPYDVLLHSFPINRVPGNYLLTHFER